MNLKNLEAFYWVVTLNSFNKAATKLQTTQPAISQKITAIENDLGFKVLDRRSRQIKATHKGMTLFKYAEKFMRLETDLVAELTESQYLTGTIRLGGFRNDCPYLASGIYGASPARVSKSFHRNRGEFNSRFTRRCTHR